MDDPRRPDRASEPRDEEMRPEDEEGAAILRERGEGAHEEQITDEANLRDDPTPPGDDEPDDG